jgi:hypothetical protein
MMARDSKQELVQEFEEEGEQYFSGGRQNNITNIVFSLVAIGSSLVATVLAGTKVGPWLVAAFAARCPLPANRPRKLSTSKEDRIGTST